MKRGRRLILAALAALMTAAILAAPSAAANAATPTSAQVALDWNLNAVNIVRGATIPLPKFQIEGLIHMSYVQAAVYDATTKIQGRYRPYHDFAVDPSTVAHASPQAAVIAAAYTTLASYFSDQPATLLDPLAAQYQAALAALPDHGKAQGVAVGQAAANDIIVDTGIAGGRPEFPPQKRSARSVSFAFAEPWQDIKGHGSMCASAAAATTAAGGRFNGVAPDAQLLSARTTLFSTDLYKLYDQLIDDREHGLLGPLVISNSYGLYLCDPPPGIPEDHPYLGLVRESVANGIVVVFAAGNNHADELCNHDPAACSPNSIWAVNSVDEVLTVGTVNADNSNHVGAHANSSRGPGQWAVQRPKPDVVAPTYGEIVWGNGYRVMEWWGTSGACPQVAGLAALTLSVNPTLQPAQVSDIIRSTARPLPAAHECVGGGLIDCRAAVEAAGS